jgi:IS30 family transposase
MTIPRPQEWTKAEVHQLRMLAKRKVSADSIAKSLGRHVGSVKTKALELRLILSKKVKGKGKGK